MRDGWIASLAIVAIALAACRGGSGEENLPPSEGGLPAALAKAKETGRNVLVYYDSESCPWSQRMREQTLSEESVRKALDDVVYVRVEQGVNAREFEKRWGKPPTPSVVTLSAEGDPLGTMVSGKVGAADFLRYVAWAKTGEGPQPAVSVGGG